MNRIHGLANIFCLAFALGSSLPVRGNDAQKAPPRRVPVSALWQDRGDIASLDLVNGAGGKKRQPAGKFTFVKEDKQGSNPKFEVIDQRGVHWKAKLGEETKSETAATRLVWAAGYFTDEDYYLPEMRVAKMPKLDRGHKFVSAGGVVHGVRLERIVKAKRKVETGAGSRVPSLEPKS
jgi:hypothetical protein